MQRKRILITGGTGFLGRHLALALRDDHEVVLGARNNKQNFFAKDMTGCAVVPLDVSSIESVRDVVAETRPEVILHAAATKFVDLAERQPMECVDVNVTGSQNIARVAIDRGVELVIGVSTDKAAPPVRNIYGLSKSVMERMFCAMDEKGATRFLCVRYGNVVWSTASIFPLWQGMHTRDGVIQSTGPDMTRFFFTVDEAVKLILTALEKEQDLRGSVLSRTMKSTLVRDILDVWIEMHGGRWEQIEGRPGDRPYEFLIGDLERGYTTVRELDGTTHYVIRFNAPVAEPLEHAVSSDTVERLTRDEIVELINSGIDTVP